MAEVRFSADKEYLEELRELTGISKTTEVTRAALTILKWAADQISHGRVILSANPDGGDVRQLHMPLFDHVKRVSMPTQRVAQRGVAR